MATAERLSTSALEPLYAPWEAPSKHRIKGGVIRDGRRPSPIVVAQSLRAAVAEWREGIDGSGRYAGASDTTLALLEHWFFRQHEVLTSTGELTQFTYHFCQREAIETLIYLLEVRGIKRLSQLLFEFSGTNAETAALGVDPQNDLLAKYAFKMATGSGKTKVMSLAIVWSYFHSLREQDSTLARDFLVIAPNITVFERLREDFAPADGGTTIFDADPLIPPEWRSDWNLNVVLQDEPGGGLTTSTLYLTNIHRLYEAAKKSRKAGNEYAWAGPPVVTAGVRNTGAELRDRIADHRRLMVFNDEAHHVWDPGSAWNEALVAIDSQIKSRFQDGGVCAQLDFSATPKDNKGQLFQHVVCDYPLGEAVDAGIVKTPVIGRASNLKEQAGDSAAIVYQRHLLLGYQRWQASRDEWDKSGKKPLLFVMAANTEAADDIAHELNTSPLYKDLNGRTINLHTNLKGKLKKVGTGANATYEFVENDKAISDDDLRALRALSRELDTNPQHYCIVSVLMLREGWDVRNVTTIVPLRPLTAKAEILPEQTLGRGLRRMMPAGEVDEVLTIIEHPAFANLYKQELSQQGLEIEVVDVDKVPKTTVTIYPDSSKPSFAELDIAVPRLSQQFAIVPKLEYLSLDEVRQRFKELNLTPLSLGHKGASEIEYEGRTLLTDEIVQQMTLYIPLLQSGMGALSYYRQQLERLCGIRGTHGVLAPLLESFLTTVLFEKRTSLEDPALVARLGDADVAEHIRAVFVPLIRQHITQRTDRLSSGSSVRLSEWKPYQATHSESHPTVSSGATLFNLVPCNRQLEVGFAKFLSGSSDTAAFAKNAGPQSLRIDYMASGTRLAFYTPDFFVRDKRGRYYLVETKGRVDRDVPAKARAAIEWCKAASSKAANWEYIYVTQDAFHRLDSDLFADLVSLSKPALSELLQEATSPQLPLFARPADGEELDIARFISAAQYEKLPPRYRENLAQAVLLYGFLERKPNLSFAAAFTPLLGSLEDASMAVLASRLAPFIPASRAEQVEFFNPDLSGLDRGKQKYMQGEINKLQRALVYRAPISPLGHLRFALSIGNGSGIGGSLGAALSSVFGTAEFASLLPLLSEVYDFRNKYIAHQEHDFVSEEHAVEQLKKWANLLSCLALMQPMTS